MNYRNYQNFCEATINVGRRKQPSWGPLFIASNAATTNPVLQTFRKYLNIKSKTCILSDECLLYDN